MEAQWELSHQGEKTDDSTEEEACLLLVMQAMSEHADQEASHAEGTVDDGVQPLMPGGKQGVGQGQSTAQGQRRMVRRTESIRGVLLFHMDVLECERENVHR